MRFPLMSATQEDRGFHGLSAGGSTSTAPASSAR
jgi:hypothetical protein